MAGMATHTHKGDPQITPTAAPAPQLDQASDLTAAEAQIPRTDADPPNPGEGALNTQIFASTDGGLTAAKPQPSARSSAAGVEGREAPGSGRMEEPSAAAPESTGNPGPGKKKEKAKDPGFWAGFQEGRQDGFIVTMSRLAKDLTPILMAKGESSATAIWDFFKGLRGKQ